MSILDFIGMSVLQAIIRTWFDLEDHHSMQVDRLVDVLQGQLSKKKVTVLYTYLQKYCRTWTAIASVNMVHGF